MDRAVGAHGGHISVVTLIQHWLAGLVVISIGVARANADSFAEGIYDGTEK